MSLAYRCEVCRADPYWTLTRVGDVVVSWACRTHLSQVLEGLQRDHEVTRVEVRLSSKAREWAEMGQALDQIAEESP